VCAVFSHVAESPFPTLQLDAGSKPLLHCMATWLRKAEVPVPVWKAATCPIRAQSNKHLQPGQEAEYA